ncbi:hypothetical protein [Lysobacter sp. CA199]|uniref:hypothetical protein n=1 Tax=Lysobacter sp. CA199 TaxID=3455608 RepID=UPI003F8D0ED1
MNIYAPSSARRLAFAFTLLAIAPAFAQTPPDGTLDPSFGHGGMLVSDRSVTPYYPKAITAQSDGKIVVLGVGGRTQPPDPVLKCHLARLQNNGQPDRSFGDNGGVAISVPAIDADASCDKLTIQPDGKIVVAGIVNDELLVLRYNPDGMPDQSFSGDGVHITDYDWDPDLNTLTPYGVAIQADGKIVVGVNASDDWMADYKVVIVRYHSNGELDKSFGERGVVLSHFWEQNDGIQANQLAIQADGKIVIAGHGLSWDRPREEAVLARYLVNGSFDPAFGHNGVATTALEGLQDGDISLVLQADGKLVTGHALHDGSPLPHPSRGTLLRHNPNGSLDTDFARPDLELPSTRLAVQADGKILSANITQNWLSTPGWMQRVNPDGTIDAHFITPQINFGGAHDYFASMTLQDDGKLLILAGLYDRRLTGLARVSNATYCIADPYNPGRFIGFSDSGWFSTANTGVGGTGFGLVGRGSIQAWNRPGVGQVHRLTASAASPAAVSRVDASVFIKGVQSWGFGNVFANGATPARYAAVDTRINAPGCVVRPGQ